MEFFFFLYFLKYSPKIATNDSNKSKAVLPMKQTNKFYN